MNKDKSRKTCLITEIVWVFYLKVDSALYIVWIIPTILFTTVMHADTFENVFFPKERPEMLRLGLKRENEELDTLPEWIKSRKEILKYRIRNI
jgi:hypothetical protein